MSREFRSKWNVFPTQPLRAIILKLVGSLGLPFLWINLTTDSPQEEGGAPRACTFVNSVAKMWCVLSSLRSTENGTPSGPGAEFLLAFFNTCLISLGLKGLESKGWKSSSWGLVRAGGYQWRSGRFMSRGMLYVSHFLLTYGKV